MLIGWYAFYNKHDAFYKHVFSTNIVVSILIISVIVFLPVLLLAEETYNLEVIFKKTSDIWPGYEGFGSGLASAGDVNGDGFDDIVIGAASGVYPGKCYLFFGGDPMDTLVDMVFYGDTAGDGFGGHRICAGYLNEDVYSDLAIGIPNGKHNGVPYGKVYVYFGGPGMDTIPDLTFIGQANCEVFGKSVCCGDINGDGADDLIVGARNYPIQFMHGRVFVFYGGALLDTVPDIIIYGHNREQLGVSVGSGGDLNNDGFEDLVAGADGNSDFYFCAGKVYAYFGGDPMDTIPDCWLRGEGSLQYLGWSGCAIMAAADDKDRMITSTQFWHGGGYHHGKVYVLYGGDPMDTLPDVWMIGADSSSLGTCCATAGDLDGDGYEDAVAGAPAESNYQGAGYVWLGTMPMDSVPDAWLRGSYSGQEIGWKVASAGDVDGDGCDEVMFSNCPADSHLTVWVCKYTGSGSAESRSGKTASWFTVYPNPFTTDIRLQMADGRYGESSNEQEAAVSIKIYDVCGREVMQNRWITEKRTCINLTHLVPGIYFLQVMQRGAIIHVEKIIKQ